MIARSANGSCTPTEFSSGGSANATGVMVTFVMRMLPLVLIVPPKRSRIFPVRRPVGRSAADRGRERGEPGGEDAGQFLAVLRCHRGERRPDPARRVAGELDARLDQRDGIPGSLRPQPGERVVEGALKRV